MEQEKQALLDKVDHLERLRTSSQKQLNQMARTNEELSADKTRLQQLLHKAEGMQESLQEELRVLRDEQKETCEKLSQVSVSSRLKLSCMDIGQQQCCASEVGFS